MRLRQAVWAARDLERVARRLEDTLGVHDPYRDPGVSVFGLANVVYALGDTFLEVVSPVQENTTAGRYLDKLGGDAGYMVIIQVEDIQDARARVDALGIRTVWGSDLDDIHGTHLHPKDTGGAILSIDEAVPPESWRWAGPGWEERSAPGTLEAVELSSPHPEALAARWADILGRKLRDGVIELDQGAIRFVGDEDGRPECLTGIDVTSPGSRPTSVEVGGVRLRVL